MLVISLKVLRGQFVVYTSQNVITYKKRYLLFMTVAGKKKPRIEEEVK